MYYYPLHLDMFRSTRPSSGVHTVKAVVQGKMACFCEISQVSVTRVLQSKIMPYTC
jgi:hypothetical protein